MNDLETMKAWQDAANSLAKFVDKKGDEKLRKAFAGIKDKWMLALQQEIDTFEEIIEAPEDATHYSHETEDWAFTYWKYDGGWQFNVGACWVKLSRDDPDDRERMVLPNMIPLQQAACVPDALRSTDIPEGATHYSHEDDDWLLTYWKKDGYTWWHSTGVDHGWFKLSRDDHDEREKIPLVK